MSTRGDIHSILHNDRNRAQQPQAFRLRKGQAPQMQEESDDDIFQLDKQEPNSIQQNQTQENIQENIQEDIQENQQNSIQQEELPEPVKHLEAKAVETIQISDRAALRAKLLAQQEASSEPDSIQQSEEEEYEEEKSDFSKEIDYNLQQENPDFSEEDEPQQGMLRPVYIPKEIRETQMKQMESEIAMMEEKRKTEVRKKEEAKLLVLESIQTKETNEDEQMTMDSDNEQNMPDDDDIIDKQAQYDLWKIRELTRIKEDRQERHKLEQLKEEIERRRNLTDEQRLQENKQLGSDATDVKKKAPYRFMQRYYSTGAFFQDSDDPIFQRDYNTAVGEDLWDKSGLPKCLQKRRDQFGKKGQSKYTHLTDQDTTNFDPYFKKDELIENKMFMKLGGQKGQALDSRLKKVKKF